jgi:hypothetical protein
MNPFDPILYQQLPVIQKIIQDETWLEAERRGCAVRSDDRIVRDKVCEVILRIGQQLRETLTGAVALPNMPPRSAAEISSCAAAESEQAHNAA